MAEAEQGGDDIFDSVDGSNAEFNDDLGVTDAGDSNCISSATQQQRPL